MSVDASEWHTATQRCDEHLGFLFITYRKYIEKSWNMFIDCQNVVCFFPSAASIAWSAVAMATGTERLE